MCMPCRSRNARLENPDTYHIPPLTPGGVELDIDGTFVIQLPALFSSGKWRG